jgi:HAE1 family hydrophobic/amphiphilic exporter-1
MQLTMDVMMRSLMALPFPPGYGLEQRGDMTQMMDSFQRLLTGLGMAMGLMYLALCFITESVVSPLVLLAAIPLELLGVFGALLLSHQTFSTVSILGMVVLNGMDLTAALLLLDTVGPHRQSGLTGREAMLAGGPTRLRPIVMTVLVTLAVMGPVAFAPRTGLDAYTPLAIVIVGGLTVSTLLTLVVIPVLYTLVADWSNHKARSRNSP